MSNSNRIDFLVRKDGMKIKLFYVYPDNSFSEVDIIVLRLDKVVQEPLLMKANQDENSLTIDGKYGILFKDAFCMEEFLNELYYTMEELHEVPIQYRTTSDNKNVTDILNELQQNYHKE